jgi:proteasome lid subunit RPN8/RPN11
MSEEPELPNFGSNNPRSGRNSDSEPQNQIVWVDSEDVYKPIPKTIRDFTAERGINETVSPVYVKADALNSLKAHLASNLRVEQGGILFGNAYEDEFLGIYVEIVAAVAAPATIATGVHLEFTPDSWLGIMDYARHQHPQENIVGWYHSHPNIGVFMSGTDMNTQRAFFYHPWCLSIVHDPVRLEIGYFLGKSARAVKPVIFGPVETVFPPPPEEEEEEKEGISEKTESSPETNTPPGTNFKGNNKFLRLPLWVWLALLVALLIVFGQHFSNTKIGQSTPDSPSTANQSGLPFKASLKSMPAKVLTYLEKEKSLLRYPVVKAGEKIGTGDEVTLLVISKEGTDVTENIQLEVKPLTPEEDVEIDNKVIDFLHAKTASFEKHSSDLGDLKSLSLPLKIGELGLMIPLFSSNVSHRGNSVSSAPVQKSKKIRKGEVIYVPIKLMYKDSKKNPKEVEIKEILKNGSE